MESATLQQAQQDHNEFAYATYSLREQCDRHKISYSTITKLLAANRNLNKYSYNNGRGKKNVFRRYTDEQFRDLLKAINRRYAA